MCMMLLHLDLNQNTDYDDDDDNFQLSKFHIYTQNNLNEAPNTKSVHIFNTFYLS